MEAVESVWRFVVCGLRSAVGGRKNQWFAACGGRSEESRVGVQEAIGRGGRKLWPWGGVIHSGCCLAGSSFVGERKSCQAVS